MPQFRLFSSSTRANRRLAPAAAGQGSTSLALSLFALLALPAAGQAEASLSLVVAKPVVMAAVGQATVAATVNRQLLSMAAAGQATAGATVQVKVPLTFAAGGAGTAGASVIVAPSITPLVAGQATAGATLSVKVPMAMALAGQASATCFLKQLQLSPQVAGQGTATAAVRVAVALTLEARGQASLDSPITPAHLLVPAIAGQASVAVAQVDIKDPLTPSATGQATAALAQLSLKGPLSPSAVGQAAAAATLQVKVVLTLAAAGQASESLSPEIKVPRSLAVAGQATVAGTVQVKVPRSMAVAGQGTLAVALQVADPIDAPLAGQATATCEVENVPQAPYLDHIVVTPATLAMVVLDPDVQLTASGVDQYGDPIAATGFTWASLDTLTATVDAAGLVTAVDDGATTIRATHTASGFTADCALTVADAVVDEVVMQPSTPQSVLVGSGVTMEATPQTALGAELEATLTWVSETPGKVTITQPGPTYKHALVTGVAAGTTRIWAVAAGAGAGGVDVTSDPVDFTVSVTAPTGEPNMPSGWVIDSDWKPARPTIVGGIEVGQGIPYPANTVNSKKWKITAAGDYTRLAIVADASAPSGYVLRIYYRPDMDGGGGPDHISNFLSTTKQPGVYLQQLKKLSNHFTNNENQGTKDTFVHFVGGTHLFINKYSGNDDSGRGGTNVDGIVYTGGAVSSIQTIFTWNNLMDGALHLYECVIKQQTATGVHDGWADHYMDGAADKSTHTRQWLTDTVNPASNKINHVVKSGTYGGGQNYPPGTVCVASSGKVVRSPHPYSTLGHVDAVDTRMFVRTDGNSFDLTSTSNSSARWWTVVKNDGTLLGPVFISKSNLTATTMRFPSGYNLTNAVAIFTGFEPFTAAKVGRTITVRSPTLDFHPVTNPLGTGLFPVLATGVVTSIGTTNFPNDTLFYTGGPTSGTVWVYGMDAAGLCDGPQYEDIGRIVLASGT